MICPQCHYVFLDPKPTPPFIQLMYCPRCWTRLDTYFGPYLTRPHDWHDIRPWKRRLSQETIDEFVELTLERFRRTPLREDIGRFIEECHRSTP